MTVGISCWCVVAVVVLFTITSVCSQKATDPPGPPDSPAGIPIVPESDFIEPNPLSTVADRFVRENIEYIFVSTKFKVDYANLVCRQRYNAKLAVIRDMNLSLFLAEALSETNLEMDSLWTSGSRLNDSAPWQWQTFEDNEPLTAEMLGIIKNFTDVEADEQDCLAFARDNHDQPSLRKLTCTAIRSFMCQRPRGTPSNDNSTHPGWIQLGRRLYKIFSEYVTYEEAKMKCYNYDAMSNLAVVVDKNVSDQLVRYLLIGRPSLENAWIGAKWAKDQYRFEAENIGLGNTSDAQPYPPWRNNVMQKTGGCILLDRHVYNATLFVEARCARLRPYICYKFTLNNTFPSNFSDVIIDERGYRLYFMRLAWQPAVDFCHTFQAAYGLGSPAYLTQIELSSQVEELLYVMGENRTAVQHIWLGGHFVGGNGTDKALKWLWAEKGNLVDQTILTLIVNDTYTEDVEKEYTCFNMDRENHISPLFYGTDCRSPQYFVCQFNTKDLLKVEEIEQKRKSPTNTTS